MANYYERVKQKLLISNILQSQIRGVAVAQSVGTWEANRHCFESLYRPNIKYYGLIDKDMPVHLMGSIEYSLYM